MKELLKEFTDLMLSKFELRAKRYKPFGWRDPEYKSLEDLNKHLHSETEEYLIEFHKKDFEKAREELIDIANTSLMIWDRLKAK